jgi:hypothetical protein
MQQYQKREPRHGGGGRGATTRYFYVVKGYNEIYWTLTTFSVPYGTQKQDIMPFFLQDKTIFMFFSRKVFKKTGTVMYSGLMQKVCYVYFRGISFCSTSERISEYILYF